MTAAKGEYVTFVDSDDYVHPAYLEMLMQGIRQGADFSVCGFIEVYDGNGIEDLDTSSISTACVNAKEGLAEILYQGFHDVSAWGSFFLRLWLENIHFQRGNSSKISIPLTSFIWRRRLWLSFESRFITTSSERGASWGGEMKPSSMT